MLWRGRKRTDCLCRTEDGIERRDIQRPSKTDHRPDHYLLIQISDHHLRRSCTSMIWQLKQFNTQPAPLLARCVTPELWYQWHIDAGTWELFLERPWELDKGISHRRSPRLFQHSTVVKFAVFRQTNQRKVNLRLRRVCGSNSSHRPTLSL